MGTTERRERQKAELRQKILEAARELFMDQGAEAVTMRKIAERIEYSPTAIYAYFPDKETLLTALCEHDFAAFLSEGAEIFAIPDPLERLIQGSYFYVDFALRHPFQYQFMFMLGGLDNFTPSEASWTAYEFAWASVNEGLKQGKLRPEWADPHEVVFTVWAALHGIAALQISRRYEVLQKFPARIRPSEKLTPQHLVRVAVDAMLRGFLRNPNAVDSFAGRARPQRRGKASRRKAS